MLVEVQTANGARLRSTRRMRNSIMKGGKEDERGFGQIYATSKALKQEKGLSHRKRQTFTPAEGKQSHTKHASVCAG